MFWTRRIKVEVFNVYGNNYTLIIIEIAFSTACEVKPWAKQVLRWPEPSSPNSNSRKVKPWAQKHQFENYTYLNVNILLFHSNHLLRYRTCNPAIIEGHATTNCRKQGSLSGCALCLVCRAIVLQQHGLETNAISANVLKMFSIWGGRQNRKQFLMT